MLTDVLNPLEVQRSIIEFVIERQNDSGTVTDAILADGLNVDLLTVRVHLESLSVEGRLSVVHKEDGYDVFVSDDQRARHEAPPPHVAAREKLERVGEVFNSVRETMNRIFSWAPLALALAGGVLGWLCAGPAMRTETAFVACIAGLIVGAMIRKELIR